LKHSHFNEFHKRNESFFKKISTVSKFGLSNVSNYFDVEKGNFILKQPSEMNLPSKTPKMPQHDVLTLRNSV